MLPKDAQGPGSRIRSFYKSQKELTTLKKQVGSRPQNNNFKVNQFKVKYGFDASQYFFRGEKKYDQSLQRHIQENVKTSITASPQPQGPSPLVSVEKLLIMCRNLNPEIYRQLIKKYQNTDDFYNNYINKNMNENQNMRMLDQQLEEQIDYYKATLQESTQQEIVPPKTIEEPPRPHHKKFNRYSNQVNNYLDLEPEEEQPVEQPTPPPPMEPQPARPNQLPQRLAQEQFNSLFCTQFSKDMLGQSHSVGGIHKNVPRKQTIQERLFSATYQRLKQRKNSCTPAPRSIQTSQNVRAQEVPPILNDIAKRAERIFSAQNKEFRKLNSQKFRNYASANQNYRQRVTQQKTPSEKWATPSKSVTPSKFMRYQNNFSIQPVNMQPKARGQ